MLRGVFTPFTCLRNTSQLRTGSRMIGKGEGVVKRELTPTGYNFNCLILCLCHCPHNSIPGSFRSIICRGILTLRDDVTDGGHLDRQTIIYGLADLLTQPAPHTLPGRDHEA